MKGILQSLLLTTFLASACAGARLSHDEARRKIAEIGTSELVPDAIEIRRIVSQTENQAIAESTVTLAFQFKKDEKTGEWRIEAVRLGDRDWVDLDELLAAMNEGRRRETVQSLQKVATGIAEYRKSTGSIPAARDIVALTDILHPRYMSELVRVDSWGNAIDYEVAGTAIRLISRGPDGRRGTADDIVVNGDGTSSP
jgi:hypothetical protein